jgi:hypothetical protein
MASCSSPSNDDWQYAVLDRTESLESDFPVVAAIVYPLEYGAIPNPLRRSSARSRQVWVSRIDKMSHRQDAYTPLPVKGSNQDQLVQFAIARHITHDAGVAVRDHE